MPCDFKPCSVTAGLTQVESVGNLVVPPMSLAELDRIYESEIARYQAIAKSINLQPQQ